jgi:hypothetical protein
MERRTILKLVAAGVLPGANGLVQIACRQDTYRPEFFSASQFDLLDSLTEVMLPSDDHSPGARAAKVARYIDVMVADSTTEVQESWRTGLEAVSNLTMGHFQCNFVECDVAQQDEVVAEISLGEDSPRSEAERFFTILKRATINGYYTSQVGIHDDLGYKGNTALDEFPGCSHESHV